MIRIILLGYMGAGKTTLGKVLANELNLPFYDLDWYIEERYRQTISQLFEKYGESGFREIEQKMLHEVAEFEDVVISSGGGTPCFFDNITYMNQQAQTVYLKAEPEILGQHLCMSTDSLAQREPFYSQARYHFQIPLLDNNEKIKDSVRKLRELLNI